MPAEAEAVNLKGGNKLCCRKEYKRIEEREKKERRRIVPSARGRRIREVARLMESYAKRGEPGEILEPTVQNKIDPVKRKFQPGK